MSEQLVYFWACVCFVIYLGIYFPLKVMQAMLLTVEGTVTSEISWEILLANRWDRGRDKQKYSNWKGVLPVSWQLKRQE